MQRLLDKTRKEIVQFIEQRDDLIMLGSCSDDDAPVLVKLCRDIEQQNKTDIFLIFVDDFVMPGPFVSVLAERLREEHRLVCEALKEEGKPLIPPIPPLIFDDKQHPSYRLYNAISYTRNLLPTSGAHRLVWIVCPQAISDRRAYLELLSPFIPKDRVQPWMRGLRLLFRDTPGTAESSPLIAKTPRLRIVPFDASPEAVQQSLDEAARDGSLPAEQRMQSLLQLALLDSAHARGAAAREKLERLLGYYQSTGNLSMQAFAMNSLGDVFLRAGDFAQAQHWYECGISLAGEAKDGVVLSTIMRNLAAIAWRHGHYAVAEQYYDGLDKLSAHLLSPEAKIDALLWRGLCQEKQGAWASAVGSWEGAATLGRSVGLPPLQTLALEHLERAYSQLGMQAKLAAVQAELSTLRSAGGANG